MEVNESEDNHLYKPKGDSLDDLKLAEVHNNSDSECIDSSEALLDKFLESAEKDSTTPTTPTWSDKEAQNDKIDAGSTSKNNAKDPVEMEKPKSFFHLSDNMKKDLSMLAFPSKPPSRKKGVISSRIIPNSRITIAEALEKAKDARKSIIKLHVTSDKPGFNESGTSIEDQSNSNNEIVNKRNVESQDMMGLLSHNDTPETSRKKLKKLDSAVTSQSVADGSPTNDVTVNESASCSEGKTVPLAGKSKSSSTSRVQMTRRMWELLKFTFIHEHFPSSVHMARLAKMMGLPWAQVRNWFTDRRVDNKKAGLYPRDRQLIDCPYCDVTLQTEEEQKGHLFSTQHVKTVLGSEYCGGSTSESIKWKKLPQTVNAVSKVSGARILAVGFSAEDFKKGKRVQEKEKMETPVKKTTPSNELKKLWTEAMLHPEEKEQQVVEWKPVKIGEEKSPDSNCDLYMEGEKEAASDLKMQDQEGKASVVVNNSRVVAIPDEASEIRGGESDNFPVAVDSAKSTSNMVAASSCDSEPVNKSVVSAVTSRDLHIKKSHQTEDISVISELENPIKVALFGKKPNVAGMLESSPESRKSSAMFKEVPHKAYKGTFPYMMKHKNKSLSSTSGSINSYSINKEKQSAKSYVLSPQYVQECESDESWKNNITLYKGDDSDAQNRYEMVVANVNKQPLNTIQSSALSFPSTQKSSRLQKSSSVARNPSLIKSGSELGLNKMYRSSIDKRKVKLCTQPLGSVLRANKATASPYEGNIIVGYQCPNCNKVYQTEWLMMKHSVTHFRYHCDICYQVYPTENMMKIHLLDHVSGAYEDEKYYCQFSCKICHSLKCGCYEPTYCKPQDLPKIFFRPQKAKRSKKGFISKLNSGPNDHLKISLSSYKKLLLSESLGNRTKEKSENVPSRKPIVLEDTPKILVLKDQKASVGDSQISTYVLREAKVPHSPVETLKAHNVERGNQEVITIKGETSHANLTKEKGPDSVAGASHGQSEVKPNSISSAEKKQIINKQKVLKWKQTQIQRELTMNNYYKTDVNPSPPSSSVNKLEETKDAPGTKRGGTRRRTTKLSSNFIYKDTDFYYMCEICDASFSSKAELSEHMFLHRLKSRIRRGEKRGISCVTEDKVEVKKLKVYEEDKETQSKTVENSGNISCDLCHSTFTTAASYRTHKMVAHKYPSQNTEVFRCNYCDKIYRRRRELKRHLKRDCVSAPSSLKGKSTFTSFAEELHYTKVKVDVEEKSDVPTKTVSRGNARGPIICKYCQAVTKREAEMKRHVWKFCLKVPSDVVKKFMDGVSLEELGFKFLRERDSAEASSTDVSQNTTDIPKNTIDIPQNTRNVPQNTTDVPQNTRTNNSGTQNGKNSMDNMQNTRNPESIKETIPEKNTSLDQLELLETSSTSNNSLHMSPNNKITTQEDVSEDSNTATKETLIIQDESEDTDMLKPSLEKGTSDMQPVPSKEQSMSVVRTEGEESSKTDEVTKSEIESSAKPASEEMQAESSCALDEASQSVASTSPLASPVMQFPVALPAMTTTAKSKRPLVCGYCGIWYFREMAILKHMKERCIKIPELEKDLLKKNNSLCNVPQKVGVGMVCDNGAVYKMVKVPEHMQNTPVPMPKEVSNEDIKELNTSIKAYSEVTPTEPATPVNEQDVSSVSVSPPANETCTSPGKRGSRCRRCHEHFSSQDAVLAHSSVHHGPKKGFYKCKLCHARLVKYKQLREHVWEHTNENPYRCHLCQVKYRSSDALVEHLQTQHQYTSINDKNLYKWLPGRHGKYRDIKTKNSSCEEKLDDVDTNLDSLAEVMVITDKDICSNTADDSKLKENENESDSDKAKYVDDAIKIKEGENLQVVSVCNEILPANVEVGTVPMNSDLSNNKDCTFDSNVETEDLTADKMDNLVEKERDTIEESSGNVSCDSPSVKHSATQKESEDKKQTSSEALTYSKSKDGLKEQSEIIITEGNDGDKNADLDESFTGEGLLPLVDNLDSVVETIQLTDKYLS